MHVGAGEAIDSGLSVVVGVCKIRDGVVKLLVGLGALFLGCIVAETKCVCANVGDGLEVDLRLPELFVWPMSSTHRCVRATVRIACQTIQFG